MLSLALTSWLVWVGLDWLNIIYHVNFLYRFRIIVKKQVQKTSVAGIRMGDGWWQYIKR